MGYNNDGPLIGGDTYFGNQNSYTKIDNQGVITQYGVAHVVANYETINDIQFDPNIVTPDYSEALMYYDSTEKTLNYFTDINGVSVNIGQEQLVKVSNATGANILNGSLVYIQGAFNGIPRIILAKADAEATSSKTLGMCTSDVLDGGVGYVTTTGIVRDIDTSAIVSGTPIWLSPTTAGGWTTTKPVQPLHSVFLGYALTRSLLGKIYINVQNGYELNELHDVLITAPVTNDVLQYNATSTVWVNVANPTLTTAKIGNVDAGNYTEFEADGTLKMVGDATVYKDRNLSGSAFKVDAGTPPVMINLQNANILIPGFIGTGATNMVYGSLEMDHDYMEGTDIELHLHWCPNTTGAGNVRWQIYASWANSGQVFPAGTLLGVTTASPAVAYQNTYSMVGTMSGVGKTINSQIALQIFRNSGDPLDTYVGYAGLIQMGIHYRVDTIGSRTITGK